MIYLKDQQKHEPKVLWKGGKGTLDYCYTIPSEELCGLGGQYGIMTIPVGCSIGPHSHTENFEIFHVLEGRARVTDNDTVMEIGPGDAEIASNGGLHAIENIGDTDLKIMAVVLWNPYKHEFK